MNQDFEEILDNCIKELREGKPADDCLRGFPEFADELRPLLELSQRLSAVPRAEPSARFLRSTKERVLNQATHQVILLSKPPAVKQAAPTVISPKGSLFQLRSMRLLAAALVAFLMFSGAIVASANTLPGDLLYPVKRGVEEVRIVLARDAGSKAGLYLDLAERRLEEAIRVLERKEMSVANGLLEDVTANLQLSMENSTRLKKREALLNKIITLTERQQTVLAKVYDQAPPKAKDAITRAIDASERGHQQAIEALSKDKDSKESKPSPGKKADRKQEDKSDNNGGKGTQRDVPGNRGEKPPNGSH